MTAAAQSLAEAQRRWQAGETERAIEHLREAGAAADATPDMLADLAELERRAGRLDAAEDAARRAVGLAPEDPVAWHRLALILIAAGRLEAARDGLARAVALAPGSIDARNNLGIVLQQLGEMDAAQAAYAGALALDPENAAANANMAAILGELGRFEAALDHARRAIAREPSLLGPYVFASLAESSLDRPEAALAWLDRALALAPESAPVLTARAELLRKLDRIEEGLAVCRQAVALAPGDGVAQNSLGLFCHALDRDDEALAAFERAAALLPQPAAALANKAMVLLELGRRAEGLALLERALEADPELVAALYSRADAKTFAAGDDDIAQMECLLAPRPPGRRPLGESDRMLLHYALGKAYLDLKEGARAFRHLNAGSRLKRAHLAYDGAAAARELAAIAEAFPASLFAARGSVGDPSALPVFIVGMPRSGTTLVEQILASHPQVAGGGEPRHVEKLVRALGPTYPGGIAALPGAEIAAIGQRYLDLVAPAAAGKRRLTDKMPNNFLHLGLIHLALPGARVIHCRRDPVDTCLSCYSKLFTTGQEFSYDMAELGRYYRCYEALMAHWRAVLPAERFIEVAYESVVADLEAEARRLVAFCGLDWDPACLSFHETARPVRSASMNQVRRPLYRSSLRRWEAFRDELGPLLEALGRS
jgi:tetratricopeptide (TPR) repeat protein